MKALRDLNDIELVNLSREGDEAAFSEIVKRNRQLIAKTVIGMLGDTPEADDVGQNTFIRFYNSLDQFKGDSKLSTYLTRIAINLSLNELKRRKRSQLLFWRSDDEEKEMVKADETDDITRMEDTEIIQKAIQSLDAEFKSVIVMRLVNGYSTKETADILDLPLGTVLSRLSRGQKKLRGVLKNEFKYHGDGR